MKAADSEEIVARAGAETTPEARDTAARLTALLRHLFRYDRGNQLRVIEESGLSLTQCKTLLELGGLGRDKVEPWQVSDLAEVFGVSVPSMSRAVDGLVKKGLATRIEDPEDRRARQVEITGEGKDLVETLVSVRRTGIESFASTLSAAQRRKLDDAVESLMEREDIAQTYDLLQGIDPA